MKKTEELLNFLSKVSLNDLLLEDSYGIEADIKATRRLVPMHSNSMYCNRIHKDTKFLKFVPFMVIRQDGTIKEFARVNKL